MKRCQFWNFFSHKANNVKKKNYRKLSIKEFDADLLKQLTLEGRVYIDVPQVVDKDSYKREILEYVHAIDDFATEMWKGQMDAVWNTIVNATCFGDSLVMKKGEQSGHMNRYTVTNIVCRMRNLGVYRKDVSMLALHLKLEGVSKKNTYYKSSGLYDLTKDARRFIMELFSKV